MYVVYACVKLVTFVYVPHVGVAFPYLPQVDGIGAPS
jgi:hypothetical protein